MMQKRTAKPVTLTLSALMQRANRALAFKAQRLRSAKANSVTAEMLGQFHIFDLKSGKVVEKHVNLVSWARANGFLKNWETLTNEC
jgi:hypothetical protein